MAEIGPPAESHDAGPEPLASPPPFSDEDLPPPSELDAFREMEHRARLRDWVGVIECHTGLLASGGLDRLDPPRTLVAGLTRIAALLQLGRGIEARADLAEIELHHGRSWQTRELAAQVATLIGDFDGAIDAATEAMISLPLAPKPSKLHRKLAVERANGLIATGRLNEARTFLLTVIGDSVAGFDELSALRRTITDSESFEAFFSVLSPHFSFPGHRARTALFRFSLACRDHGKPDLAIAAARQRFLSGIHIVRYGSRKQDDKSNWADQAALALFDLRTDLSAMDLDFFLISGTLLGCIRQGTILGHDKDIDVGVLTDRSAAEIRTALASTGRFKVKFLSTDRLVQVQHANGVMIDVFLHWHEDGRIYHEGLKARWWNSEFSLIEAEFLGKTFLVPADADRYLSENYGPGWRTPEPDFETFVDTPNMEIQDEEHMTWYYFIKLHDYYFMGKPLQFQKVWAVLDARIGPDAAVRKAVDRVFAEIAHAAPTASAEPSLGEEEGEPESAGDQDAEQAAA